MSTPGAGVGPSSVCVAAALLAAVTGCGEGCPAPPPRAAAPQILRPFNGKDLTGWIFEGSPERHFWKVGTAKPTPGNPTRLTVTAGGSDLCSDKPAGTNLFTEEVFGDHRIEIEVLLPAGSNAGIFVHGEYELQLIDESLAAPEISHGAIARLAAPKTRVDPTPGEWQAIRIDFRAPRFDAAGKKIADARFERVEIGGLLIHENLAVQQVTLGGLTGEEHPEGPLALQGNEGAVAFRNLQITPLSVE